MAGLRAYDELLSLMKEQLPIVPSHIFLYSGFTIVQSITVAGAALGFHQLPSFVFTKHHKNEVIILRGVLLGVKRRGYYLKSVRKCQNKMILISAKILLSPTTNISKFNT